jgi:A/G-specific adenine glycosylase
LRWFDRQRRDFPWRQNRDPYRIWVSEVMLQQTQAATVRRFYEPFLEAFPSLRALAAADEQQVLRFWQGLGYYRRARHLHAAARRLVREHGSSVPDDPDVFATLPGVGRYMLGAVLSQAFDRRLPVVDANCERVLCRLFGFREDPRGTAGRRWLWQTAEMLLPTRRVGDFNQALMELGALVCTPAPRCGHCPLADSCVVQRLGLQKAIPARRPSPPIIVVREVAVVVRRGRRVLLVQCPDEARWAGMWEFPRRPLSSGETHERAASRLLREYLGIEAELGSELVSVRHTVTNHRITLSCFQADYRAGRFKPTFYRQARWVSCNQIHEYPLATPQRRISRALTEASQRQLF